MSREKSDQLRIYFAATQKQPKTAGTFKTLEGLGGLKCISGIQRVISNMHPEKDSFGKRNFSFEKYLYASTRILYEGHLKSKFPDFFLGIL